MFLFFLSLRHFLFFWVTVPSSDLLVCLPLQRAMTEDWDCMTQMVNNLLRNIWIFSQKYIHWFVGTLATDDTFGVKQIQIQWLQLDIVQNSSDSDLLLFKRPQFSLVYCGTHKKELSGFPLRTGHDWCLLRRKLSCRSQIENNINRFIFGSFCLWVNLPPSKKPHKYILKDLIYKDPSMKRGQIVVDQFYFVCKINLKCPEKIYW